MKNKCNCYYVQKKGEYFYCPNGSIIERNIDVGVCLGTKEIDECSCCGDKTKCDFYPKVREKAKREVYIKDAINHFKYGISHDIFKEPVTTYAKLAIEALENWK